MYQHHIQLRVGEMLTASEAIKWYHAVEEYGPESIVMPFMHNGNEIAMEYGIADGDEFEHCYTVPLKRDLTTEETAFIIGAWEYMFTADFDIEISNQYNAGMMGDFENSFEIDPEVKQMAIADMSKNHHNRWVEGKIAEGWRHGAYYNSREKTHPALRNWDILPESHKRSPEFTDQEIYEWVLKKQGKFVEGGTNRYVMTPHQNLPNTKSMTGGTTMVTKGFRDMQQAQARTQASVDARQGAGQSQIGTAPKVSKTDFSPNVFPRTGPKKPRN